MFHLRIDMPFYLMSLYGSIMLMIILLLRILFRKKLPKFVFPVLWSVVLFRLLVPFSLSSPISFPVPDWQFAFAGSENIYYSEGTSYSVEKHAEAAKSGSNGSDIVTEAGTSNVVKNDRVPDEASGISYGIGKTMESRGNRDLINFYHSIDGRIVVIVFFGIGAAITVGVLFYQKYCYTRKLKDSMLLEQNEIINGVLDEMKMKHVLVFSNDHIASPLVSGLFRQKIYLPTRMEFQNKELLRHILLHETIHIKHKDNLIKAVMLLALCLNWYNPLVWLMSKCLSSDLEAACDAAVLKNAALDERQSYAGSLLAMAISGNKTTLLYSAFSRTEVERRIKDVLRFKKVTAITLMASTILLAGSITAFAAGVQAPYSNYLSSFCGSTASRWGVKAMLSRDIVLGDKSGERADDVILKILNEDTANDPDIIAEKVRTGLAREFGVEKNAFRLMIRLCPGEEETLEEYAVMGLTSDEEGFHLYQGEKVRYFMDEMLGAVQQRPDGKVDISIQRDRLGEIISVNSLYEGDGEFDKRTGQIKQGNMSNDELKKITEKEDGTVVIQQVGN